MASVKGYIKFIDPRETSVGTMYDVNVDGVKYGAGKFAPKAAVGDYVEITYSENGRFKNIDKNGLKVLPAPANGGGKPSASGSSPGYDSRQEVISKQAASNTAIAWLDILIKADALPVVKAAKDKKADLMDALRLKYTAEFYQLATGNELQLEELDKAAAESAAPDSWDE